MTRPEDLHHVRVDSQAFEIVRLVVPFLEERGFHYVLAGGWAAYGYGTRVASADTDVFIRDDEADEVNRLVEAELGVTTGRGGRFETLSMQRFNRILGTDWELGEPDRGYVPADLLDGHIKRVTLNLTDATLEANAPEPREFAFTKLKALHDRELAYRAVRDPSVRARISPADWGELFERTEGYYAAKAGKDLFDAAYMFAHHVDAEIVLDLAKTLRLREDLELPLRRPDPNVRSVALGLARDEPTREWLDKNMA